MTPFYWDHEIWLGCLAIGIFFLSIMQLRVDWKGRVEAHSRSCTAYWNVKRESGYLISLNDDINENDYQKIFDVNNVASSSSIAIPDRLFPKLKKTHLLKVEISRYLSKHPGASIYRIRFAIWWRDNIQVFRKYK